MTDPCITPSGITYLLGIIVLYSVCGCIAPLALAGGGKKGQKYPSRQQHHDLVGPRLDIGCQHHTSGTGDASCAFLIRLQEKQMNMPGHSASAQRPEGLD